MSQPRQGSTSKDTHWRIGKQDEETRVRDSLQVQASSHKDRDEEFKKRHSPRMKATDVNGNQQQQPQLTRVSDGESKESYQSSSRSQGHTQNDYPPRNHQIAYPIQQQQSSTKISTSEELTSKNDSLPSNQNIRRSPQEEPKKYEQLLSSDGVHSPTKDDYPRRQSQSSYGSKHSSQASTPSLKNKPQQCNQISYESHPQPSPVTASSPSPPPKRYLSEDEHHASCQNSKHLKQPQPSTYSTDEPHKQMQHPKHCTAPQAEFANTSPVQQDAEDDHEPHRSQSPPIKPDPSAQRHAAPLESEEHENVNNINVGPPKLASTPSIESSHKNVRPLRKQNKDTSKSKCPCCIL